MKRDSRFKLWRNKLPSWLYDALEWDKWRTNAGKCYPKEWVAAMQKEGKPRCEANIFFSLRRS